MKTEIKRLHEKASQLLEMAQAMDRKVALQEGLVKAYQDFPNLIDKYTNQLDNCQRGSVRLWSAYKMVLLQILEL